MDNGPELIAWALRDGCRLSGTGTISTERGRRGRTSTSSRSTAASRDELLNIEEFGSVAEAKVIVEDWRIKHTTYRPHGSLSRLTSVECDRQWTAENQLKLP